MSGLVLCRAIIPGQPVPKGRPRVLRNGHTYTPRKTAEAEQTLRMEIRVQAGRPLQPSLAAVEIEADFYLRGFPRVDVDNLGKLVMDALNGMAFRDDAQVWATRFRKWPGSTVPRTELTVRTFDVMRQIGGGE
ncbi:MAG: RusA family crossover junction endodeoxyribonuclease [Patescibacteria group bacterium]|nr:RusA family crossover junction endodeoxyribonuclease [Patescibacteria group bacterium]